MGGRGDGGGGRGRVHTYRYTLTTTTMTPLLRCAAMRAILIFINCEGQGHKTVSTNRNLFEEPERRAEAESSRDPSAYKTGKNKIPTLLRERERERERESHCVGCHCFCAVWVLIA